MGVLEDFVFRAGDLSMRSVLNPSICRTNQLHRKHMLKTMECHEWLTSVRGVCWIPHICRTSPLPYRGVVECMEMFDLGSSVRLPTIVKRSSFLVKVRS